MAFIKEKGPWYNPNNEGHDSHCNINKVMYFFLKKYLNLIKRGLYESSMSIFYS